MYINSLVPNSSLHGSYIQWNPSIAATVGEWHFGCYTEVAVVEGFRVVVFGPKDYIDKLETICKNLQSKELL